MRMIVAAIVLLALVASAQAFDVEIDFSQPLLDLDGKPYRDCKEWDRSNPPVCQEWVEHTLGLIAFSALNLHDPKAGNAVEGSVGALLENARRGALAEKAYKGGVVKLDTKQVDLILEGLAKLRLPSVELKRAVEMLDASRLKSSP